MRRNESLGITMGALALALLAVGCEEAEAHQMDLTEHQAAAQQPVEVEKRAHLLPTYPCSSCHQGRKPDPNRRKLEEFHTIRNKELKHGNSERWCYQCHSIENIDKLVISSGKLVSFDEAYLVCGSCHGDKLRDWRVAVHGKTMGGWKKDKIRRSCTGCHNPHAPKFGKLEPEQAPLHPEDYRPR